MILVPYLLYFGKSPLQFSPFVRCIVECNLYISLWPLTSNHGLRTIPKGTMVKMCESLGKKHFFTVNYLDIGYWQW